MTAPVPIHTASLTGSILTIAIQGATINTDDALCLQDEFRLLFKNFPPGAQSVHLEVSEVLAMSSRGFESLLLLHRGCIDKGIPLTVSNLTPIFHRLLSRMGFLRLLKIEDA